MLQLQTLHQTSWKRLPVARKAPLLCQLPHQTGPGHVQSTGALQFRLSTATSMTMPVPVMQPQLQLVEEVARYLTERWKSHHMVSGPR